MARAPKAAKAKSSVKPALRPEWPADKIELWPIGKLIPSAQNAREHSAAQIEQIARSIDEFGWTVPCIVDEAGELIAGHGRVQAAAKRDIREVPVIVARGWSEAQKRAYRIADNAVPLNASWNEAILAAELAALQTADFDIGLFGFDEGMLDRLLPDTADTEGLVDEDFVPPVPKQAVTRLGDLWLMSHHRLLCGDSTSAKDVTRLMNGERAALFATDPPYLVDYDGTNHPTKKSLGKKEHARRNKDWSDDYVDPKHWDDSSQGPQFYEAFCKVAIDVAIGENVAWYCWHASRRQAMLEAVWDKFDVFNHQQIIWVKSRKVLTRSILLWQHEPCLLGWKRGHKPRVNREGFDGWPSTIWDVPSSEVETLDHPTSKPVRLFTLPMELHTAKGEVCYEPFSGSGSQLIAGQRTGRRVFGLELSDVFCDVVIQRWQAFTGRQAVLDGDGRTYAEIAAERGVPLPEAQEAAA